MLDRRQVRAFYDRLGGKLDTQRFYEDPAIRQLLVHGRFESAKSVFELGCGTGRFAHELLSNCLSGTSTYQGYDLSPEMVRLAEEKISGFGERAHVHLTDGSLSFDVPDASIDRFVANYVLDLLPHEDIETAVREAYRMLEPGGYLCLVSLSYSQRPLSRLIVAAWKRVHRLRPGLVGGCRPLHLEEFVSPHSWEIHHHEVVVALGMPSEVLIAGKLADRRNHI